MEVKGLLSDQPEGANSSSNQNSENDTGATLNTPDSNSSGTTASTTPSTNVNVTEGTIIKFIE